jgi:hypothetical protein
MVTIEIAKSRNPSYKWDAYIDLPGQYPVGCGRSQQEAVAHLFLMLLYSEEYIKILKNRLDQRQDWQQFKVVEVEVNKSLNKYIEENNHA